ncbi:MAG TPA: tRNA (adenosine(37)-N6)-threonylcarbamoyltransferase complex transferase subunit TsaD [Acidimicrobiales bacterium]|nr:tRNA (adenosine(37)-N6)-threonylcarbamoyltransferase complex transferase subunit TsaD [Acidimicrobiales bacterium]
MTTDSRLVLGIETSCDETAAAVVAGGTTVLSSVVSSQIDLHARFGGVVPELAGRAHLVTLGPVIDDALQQAGAKGADLAAVAVTKGPGLIGALLVGVSHAKALALAWGLPFVGVNHLEGHIYACLLERPDLPLPAIVLLVSGGHTMLIHVRAYGEYTILGGTIDDAAGEAYDKVARVLGLGYPGGPFIDRAAKDGDPKAVPMPRLMRDDSYDFSFSGIKTAVARRVAADPSLATADVAAGFQKAVVDSLVSKAEKAVVATGAAALCLAGGVAANSELRARTSEAADRLGVECLLPAMKYCTDNAAMIAAAGWWRLQSDGATSLDESAYPNLRLATS